MEAIALVIWLVYKALIGILLASFSVLVGIGVAWASWLLIDKTYEYNYAIDVFEIHSAVLLFASIATTNAIWCFIILVTSL